MRFTKLGQIYYTAGVVPVLFPIAALAAGVLALITWPFCVAWISFWQAWGVYCLALLLLGRRLLKPRLGTSAIKPKGSLSYDR